MRAPTSMVVPIAALLAGGAPSGCEQTTQERRLPAATDWNQPSRSPRPTGADPQAGEPKAPAPGGDVSAQTQPAPMSAAAHRFVRGKIVGSAKIRSLPQPGTALYVSAWRYDPTTGEPIRPPLAAKKLASTALPASFELSEANRMLPGTPFAGPVLIKALLSFSGDAMPKRGDLVGTARADIPATDIDVVLDTVVP